MKEIKVKYYDWYTRHEWRENVRVVRSTTYKGTEIWRGVDGQWYYVFAGEWQYFGTLGEAKRFINNLA